MSRAMGDSVPPGKAHGDRWCGRYHRRSYAYPTIDLAWHSFRIRKMRQVEHLQRALTRAAAVSEAIKDIVKPPVTDRYVDLDRLDGRLLKREEIRAARFWRIEVDDTALHTYTGSDRTNQKGIRNGHCYAHRCA